MSPNFHNILAINASAGSGKTYQLTLRYLTLLFLGAHPSKILAVTFTKKAAKEMKERIAKTLMRLSAGELPESDSLICAVREVYDGDIRQKANSLLSLYLSSNNKISTIDSFVHQILRKFCFYASVRHDFGLLSLSEEELRSRFLGLLDEGQKERLADYLYVRGESLEKTLSLFASLYEDEGDLEPIKKRFAGYDRGEFFAAREELIAAANRFYAFLSLNKPQKFAKREFEGVNEFLKTNSFEKLITERENLQAHRDYRSLSSQESEEIFAKLKAALARYYEVGSCDTIAFLLSEFEWYKRAKESLLREKNGLGFDDVAKIVKELLEEGRVDSDFLYFRLDGEIEHILIDEFQDTSILQFRIIRPLLDEIISGIGAGGFKSFFLVGDPKQSIYRFRGAASGMFENATEYIRAKAEDRYKEIFLDTNYRSAATPVEFVNNLFLGSYGDSFVPQKSSSKSVGFVECVLADEERTLETVLEKVSSYIKAGALPESITILCYTNDDIEELSFALEERGIKTQKESSKNLVDDENVRAVLLFLEYLLLRSIGKSGNLARLGFLTITKAPKSLFEASAARIGAQTSASKAVFEVVETFFLSSPNTMKLIELAMKYPDIQSFVGSEALKNEKKISIRQPGVALMSIHKSKGLEFDYCIICDTLKKKNSSKNRAILLVHESFRLKELVLTGKSIAAMLLNVRKALEAESAMEERDLQNANYVAMTRAKSGMCIIKKADGYSKLSAFSLKNGVIGELSFESTHIKNGEKVATYKGAKLERKLGAQEDFARENVYAPDDYDAINFGLALHSYFEISHKNTEDSDATLYLKNRYGVILRDEVARVAQLASSLDLASLGLEDGAQIFKEVSICAQENGDTRLYRIDFLAIDKTRAVIVDFKSSGEAKEEYKKQLQNYSKTVSQILGLEAEGYLAINKNGRLELLGV